MFRVAYNTSETLIGEWSLSNLVVDLVDYLDLCTIDNLRTIDNSYFYRIELQSMIRLVACEEFWIGTYGSGSVGNLMCSLL